MLARWTELGTNWHDKQTGHLKPDKWPRLARPNLFETKEDFTLETG